MTVRGIKNPSGTACHISSALVVFCHCLVPVRQAIEKHPPLVGSGHATWWSRFQAFCRRYCLDEATTQPCDDPVDPTQLYEAMRRDLGLDYRCLGDAVTAFMKILEQLRLVSPTMRDLMELTVDGGMSHFLIQGYRNGEVICCKETKSRPLSSPLSLSANFGSIQAALDAKLGPATIDGYHWTIESANQQQEGLETRRSMILDRLPNLCLVHLDRKHEFATPNQTSKRVLVSPTLTFKMKDDSCTYELVGGILHVIDIDRDEEEEEEGDHNAALVRQTKDRWVLVDDESATIVMDDLAMELFNGCETSLLEKGSFTKGMLLVYRSTRFPDEDANELIMNLEKDASKIENCVQCNQQYALIGRRLAIQWASGKEYQGYVSGYDEATGKHTVSYDDGDVRCYVLEKKTLRWL